MRAHIEAIEGLIEDRGYQVYFGDVTDRPTFPYVVVWSHAGLPGSDSLGACDGFLRGRIGVTSVSLSGLAALDMQQEIRSLLGPSTRKWKRLSLTGYDAFLRLFDSRPVEADRQVTVTDADLHPMFGVDIFELDSQER